jgi:hypothetical protein
MTEAQLKEIKERARDWLCDDVDGVATAGRMARTDIPALCAEVWRLRVCLEEFMAATAPLSCGPSVEQTRYHARKILEDKS